MRPLSLFCLNTSRTYSSRVAAHLGIELADHEERHFEDGEHKCRSLIDVCGHDVYVVHSLHGDSSESVDKKLCKLLFFIGSLKDVGAHRVTAVMPYLCYSRKDQRTQPHDPTTTRYVAAMFEAVGVDRVATIDVHNVAAYENAFRCRRKNLKAKPLFIAHFSELARSQNVVVVAPDFGGAKRAEDFRKDLAQTIGSPIELAVMEKHRSGGVVSGSALSGDVAGKTAIILDDLISTGGTLRRAAHACRAGGANRVYAAATHGLFMPGASELLADTAIDAIVVTDTITPDRLDITQYGGRLKTLESSKLIADAIKRWHEND
ncbi:MAG: ribose-phosphate pyrophosphokinase [Spongiibacteraceae bacterium]